MPATAPIELFDAPLPLGWLPDETVYSFGARYRTVAGIVNPRANSRVLFGYRFGGFPHSLPSGIGYFARLSPSTLGLTPDIIAKHTIAPQLVATRANPLRDATYRAMEGKHAGTLKARLGLLASGFGGALPLKACPVCVAEDTSIGGFSYWHATQQLPGVWICSKHRTLLHVSTIMRSGEARYTWILPNRSDLRAPCVQDPVHAAGGPQRLSQLADASRWLWIMGQRGGIDLSRAIESIWNGLYEADLARRPHRLRASAASKSFCEFFGEMRVVPELARVGATPSIAYSQLLTVLNAHPDGCHPVRLACVVAWLFSSISTFTQMYDSCNAEPTQSEPASGDTRAGLRHDERERFLELVTRGSSISAAAQAVDIEVATGQAWAASAGHNIPRRASVIREDMRERLIESLQHGTDKVAVASEFHISISSVNRILRTEPGLHGAWRASRSDATRRTMRDTWMYAMAEAGNRAKIARSLQPAAYAWLYRNDSAWLHHANLQRDQHRSNNASVDWRARDDQLSSDVLRIAAAMQARAPQQPRLLDLLAELPALKRHLSNLGQLPLTDRALAGVLKRRRRGSAPDLFDPPPRSD